MLRRRPQRVVIHMLCRSAQGLNKGETHESHESMLDSFLNKW